MLECIKALRQHGEVIDVFVIDNASTDGTLDALQYLIEAKEIKYFNTNKNLGGADSFNYGMKHEWIDKTPCKMNLPGVSREWMYNL